jgi:hypothetical protein
VKVLCEEGLDEVRFLPWDWVGWQEGYALALGSGATQEQERWGWVTSEIKAQFDNADEVLYRLRAILLYV